MAEINNKMMKSALSKLNPQESVKILKAILNDVQDVYENQKQMAPAMISIWDRLEYIERKIDYQTQLVQGRMREDKLPYDEFTEQAPEPHIKMEME